MSNSQNPQQLPSREYKELMKLIEETPAEGEDLALRWRNIQYSTTLDLMKNAELRSAKNRALNLFFLGCIEQDLGRDDPRDALQNLGKATKIILDIAASKGWAKGAHMADVLELIKDLVMARINTAWEFRQIEHNTIL